MGYPSGVVAFTAKNAGDSIQPAHVNDLQTEITAVENALLNGVSHPLTLSSGLTVSTGATVLGGTLQVAGNSTVAGALMVGGALTVTGATTLTGGIGRQPSVKLTHTSSQTAANGAWTGLDWDTELTNTGALHSTAVNSSRINLTSSGCWMIGGEASFQNTANPSTLNYGVRVRLNDASELVTHANAPGSALQLNPYPLSLSVLHVATSTADFVTFQVYQSANASQQVNGSTAATQFWALKVCN